MLPGRLMDFLLFGITTRTAQQWPGLLQQSKDSIPDDGLFTIEHGLCFFTFAFAEAVGRTGNISRCQKTEVKTTIGLAPMPNENPVSLGKKLFQ